MARKPPEIIRTGTESAPLSRADRERFAEVGRDLARLSDRALSDVADRLGPPSEERYRLISEVIGSIYEDDGGQEKRATSKPRPPPVADLRQFLKAYLAKGKPATERDVMDAAYERWPVRGVRNRARKMLKAMVPDRRPGRPHKIPE